jgi:RNA polymerase sigma-70 factor (ECF subfamily)
MPGQTDFTKTLVAQLPALRRYAIALAGNAAWADDLVQDCIEKALRQSSQLRDPRRLPGWTRRILYNLYIDEMRQRQSRGPQQDIMDMIDHPQLQVPGGEGMARDFVKAMAGLNPEHREILLLVGLEDLSYREIAEELAVPIGTVMSRLARARERLRQLLEGRADSNVIPLPLSRKGTP